MAGLEKFLHGLRQGSAIRRKSWGDGTCVTSVTPGGEVFVFEGTKSVGDGLTFSDMFAGDWEMCEVPDLSVAKKKPAKKKVAPKPTPMPEPEPLGGLEDGEI